LNNQFLLPTAEYIPGTPPPPHLSPFTDSKVDGYVPTREKEILHLKGEEVVDSESEVEDEEMNEEPKDEVAKVVKPAKKAAAASKKDTKRRKGDADSSSDD